MARASASLMGIALLAGGALQAESSEYPLVINLPTAERMQYWDIGGVFTHRFVQPTKGHSKDLYGLDGYSYSGFGFTFGIKPVTGLNLFIYRTPDNKTLTFGFQEQVLNGAHVRMALRAERFDETVQATVTPLGNIGISGITVQLPTEIFITDDLIFSLVPTYITKTTTTDTILSVPPGQEPKTSPNKGGVFNVGLGLRYSFTEAFSFVSEYYPRPSKFSKASPGGFTDGTTYQNGFSAGVSYKTFKHRFTLVGTNTMGTTPNQVLSGDYGGGPRPSNQWSLGFNITRIF
jgi:opacity protein-like surface antigen